jgi:peroxiredoxin
MNQIRGLSFAYAAFWVFVVLWCHATVAAKDETDVAKTEAQKTGLVKTIGNEATVKPGDPAPDFALRDLAGAEVRLSHYRGKENVVISFIPAAWTPVCSQQWPGYNIAKEIFAKYNTTVLGISEDNTPTLAAWTEQMGGLWFPVLSDFWPHGAVAKTYGVLRDDGMAERALFVIDKQGVIRYVDVHEASSLPRLEVLVKELEKLPR